MKRTVIGAASIEAKQYGVKTGMAIWEAQKLCPNIILVRGDSDKYLEVTKRFLNILKDYSPAIEIFSIDEVFLQATGTRLQAVVMAQEIKQRIRTEIGEWMRVSIGISYNKLMAKLASNLKKPDGLVIIADESAAIKILDQIELDEICGIGRAIKQRLFNLGVTDFKKLRAVPLKALLAGFKSYGQILYNMSRGIDESVITPFYEKEEVKSVGHRHTIFHDTKDEVEIKQILLKLTELIARKLRAKQLVGKTVSCWFRYALNPRGLNVINPGGWKLKMHFEGDGMQISIPVTSDGLEIFQAAWQIFHQIWNGSPIRMIGASIANLKPQTPQNLSLLPETNRQETIIRAIDKINNRYGEFTLQRGILLGSGKIYRKANSFLADRRFMVK